MRRAGLVGVKWWVVGKVQDVFWIFERLREIGNFLRRKVVDISTIVD